MAPKPKQTAAGPAKQTKTTKSASGVKKSTAARKPANSKKSTPAAASQENRRSRRLRGDAPPAEPHSGPPAAGPADGSSGNAPPQPPPQPPAAASGPGPQTAATDDSSHEPGNPLASATFGIECDFGQQGSRQQGILRGILQVYADVDSRLGYKATFEIAPRDDSQEPSIAGFIDSWRIDRKTTAKPNARALWIEELLKPKWDAGHPSGAVLNETRLCLQALYTDKGNLRRNRVPVTHAWRPALENDGIIFIQMIGIAEQFQRQGLLEPMLRCYRTMLQRLPEWFAFGDTLLLVPGAPQGSDGDVWDGVDDATVENILTTVYSRTGVDFEVLVQDAVVSNTALSVMGRAV